MVNTQAPRNRRTYRIPVPIVIEALLLGRWAALSTLAILGSLAYGASLGYALHNGRLISTAAWIALSAGLAWCVFVQVLSLACRRSFVLCVDACLVAMACGEAVLLAGAGVNLLLAHLPIVRPPAFNIACVAFSNIAMARGITRQMAAMSVPRWKTLSLWMVALNGSGAIFFFLLKALLIGGANHAG